MNNIPSVAHEDLQSFDDVNGEEFRYVRFMKNGKILAWTEPTYEGGWTNSTLTTIDPMNVKLEVLKAIGVWDQLPEDTKQAIETETTHTVTVSEIEEKRVLDKMAKAREAKVNKYPQFPKELVCVKCGAKANVVASALSARLDRLNTDIESFLKVYQCQSCNPTKGRKPSGNSSAPSMYKVKCVKCGTEVMVQHSNLVVRSEKAGVTVEKFIAEFQCQTCRPSKRGRQKND